MSWLSRLRSSLGRARESFSAVTRLGRPERPLTPEFLGRTRGDAHSSRFRRAGDGENHYRLADRRKTRRVEDRRSARGALSQRRRAFSHAARRDVAARPHTRRHPGRGGQRQRQDDDDRQVGDAIAKGKKARGAGCGRYVPRRRRPNSSRSGPSAAAAR